MKTVEKVFEALKNEGLVPVMENFGISFKFQMTNYVYMEDENDESFFNLLIPNIYDVSEKMNWKCCVLSTMSTIR